MINTYNESKLHKTLKELYQIQYGGTVEVPVGPHICDVVAENGWIIEIQTKNLGKLLPKLLSLRDSGKKVLLVHPLIQRTIIESYSEEGDLLSRRKSPKKNTWHDLFTELMGIYSILNADWFELEIPMVTVKEIRIRTEEPVQLPNKSRKFKKNWYKKDKELLEILETRRFSEKKDYLSLLPPLSDVFCAKDLISATGSSNAYKICWVLKKSECIVPVKKQGRTTYYSFSR